MRTRIILNPSAGNGQAVQRLQAIRLLLETHWQPIDWQLSRSTQHVTDLAREAVQADYAQVIVAGGDGTVHYAANGIVGSQVPLGILPVGTGNDIAMSLGLSRHLDVAAKQLIQAQHCYYDVIQVGSRFSYCVLGMGMDTPALQRINASRLPRGRLMYSGYALRTLFDYRAQPLTIKGDGIDFDGHIIFVAMANTATYAGGIPIAPGAKIDDGHLNLCIIPAMSKLKSLLCFNQVMTATHIHRREVLFKTCTHIQVTGDVPITLDGELTDLTLPLTIQILPQALLMLGGHHHDHP